MSVTPKIILAPMEGVVDALMRDMLTQIGGFDLCVTEFVRVVENVMSDKVFYRICPELKNDGFTPSGIPVKVQLLGQQPKALAQNAVKAVKLGSHGVDLNFGCPAKTVNRHRGGAALLTEPELLREIVASVRAATPAHIPVTAKMRLGLTDTSQTLECAQALADGGAGEITVHARTKVEGYKPPAHWEWLARIREAVAVPVIANGEVWTTEDYRRIREVSGCDAVMIGRGLVRCPDLGLRILQDTDAAVLGWDELWPWLGDFFRQTRLRVVDRHSPGRLKQWLAMLGQHYPQARELFDSLRRETSADVVTRRLEGPLESAA